MQGHNFIFHNTFQEERNKEDDNMALIICSFQMNSFMG